MKILDMLKCIWQAIKAMPRNPIKTYMVECRAVRFRYGVQAMARIATSKAIFDIMANQNPRGAMMNMCFTNFMLSSANKSRSSR